MDGNWRRAVTGAVLGPTALIMLGGGALTAPPSALAAGPAATAAPGALAWHRLALVNGWQTAPGGTAPAWAVRGGITYLTGSLAQAPAGPAEFAVLPRPARPDRIQYLVAPALGGGDATVTISPSGALSASSRPAAGARGLTSLAGIAFPAAGTARHALGLSAGWASGEGRWGTGDPACTVVGGVVYLSGSMYRASGHGTGWAHLPPAARPPVKLFVTVYTARGAAGALLIYPDGQVLAFLGNSARLTSLAGVSFPVARDARHPLALRNGWESAHSKYGTATPAYSVVDGVVYLSGGIRQPHGSSGVAAVLPAALRPARPVLIKTYAAGLAGTAEIAPDGTVTVASVPGVNARILTSLESVSYPLR